MKCKCDFCEDVVQHYYMKLELPFGQYAYFCDDICFSGWLDEHLTLEDVDEDEVND